MGRMWVEFSQQADRGLVGTHRWWSGEIGKRGWASLPPDQWDPPLRPVPGKGYPKIFVEAGDVLLEFISTTEMLDMAEILERPIIDTETSQRRWYRKLPASLKSRHGKGRTAKLIRKAAAAFESQLPAIKRMPSAIPSGGKRGPVFRVDLRL